jgi:DNA-binding transcriptional LysR family regulator
MDMRQLRYFIAVAETGHFGRAAERLHVTQPPLSRQVAALEQALGVRLFDRHSRRVRLTHAGERLLIDGRAVLAAFDEACRNAQRAAAGDLGELIVGFMMHAAYGPVPALTRRFIGRHPEVRLSLRETLPAAILDGVADGTLDAGITFAQGAPRGIATHVLFREPLVLALPAGHALANRAEVRAEHLIDQPLIATPADVAPMLHRATFDYLASVGEKPLIRLETQLQQTIVTLVAEGIGLALVPRSLQRLELAGVAWRPLADAPQVEHMLAWRRGNLNPVLPRFLDLI